MKHLILGSRGQIGNELVNFLKKNQEECLGFDILNEPAQDLRNKNNPKLLRSLAKADFVHFLAFDVGGSRYLKTYQYSKEFISNNLRIMEYTFEALSKSEKPFIFASSQMSNMNYSPYGTLKSIGESYTRALNGRIVKFWNVYGVEHDLNKSHVITDFIIQAKKQQRIKMLTDGQEFRQFLHAEDCSRGLHIISKKHSKIPRTADLCLTNFHWSKIYCVAEIISKMFGDVPIIPAKNKDIVQKNLRNQPDTRLLDYWQPKINLQTGIRMVAKSMGYL